LNLTQLVRGTYRFALATSLCALLVLPVAPSIYVLVTRGGECFATNHAGRSVGECLAGYAFFAPFAFFLGDLVSDDAAPSTHWTEACVTALAIGCICALMGMIWVYGKRTFGKNSR